MELPQRDRVLARLQQLRSNLLEFGSALDAYDRDAGAGERAA
jgi:hypothetical protein